MTGDKPAFNAFIPIYWMLVDVVFLKGGRSGQPGWGLFCWILAACGTQGRKEWRFLPRKQPCPCSQGVGGGRTPARGDLELSRTQGAARRSRKLMHGQGLCLWGNGRNSFSVDVLWRNLFQPRKQPSGLAKGKPEDRTSLPNYGRRFLYKSSNVSCITSGWQISLFNIFFI